MNLIRVLRWSNGLLFLSAFLQIVTGLMLFGGIDDVGPFSACWVHTCNGFVFIILSCVYVALNWPWFKALFFRRKPVSRLPGRPR